MTISEQIENDLRAHVVAGEEPPYALTLSGIAQHFEVSEMPVRRAVDALLEQSFLIRTTNGRLKFNAKRKSRSKGKSVEEALAIAPEIPERDVKDFVIGLSLRGSDQCLREQATAEQFGISRTVLRRILNRLAGEGVIEHLPRRGWRIRPFREQDMFDYLDIRKTLELRALELAFDQLDTDFLNELHTGNSAGPDGKAQLDNRLHRYWIDLADNRYLSGFFDQNAIYFDTLFARAVLDDQTVAKRSAEHREILLALIDKRLPEAKSILEEHILNQRCHLTRLLDLFES